MQERKTATLAFGLVALLFIFLAIAESDNNALQFSTSNSQERPGDRAVGHQPPKSPESPSKDCYAKAANCDVETPANLADGRGPTLQPLASKGAARDPPPVLLELGYGPSGMSPVGNGVPVYTAGDSLWAMSGYNQSVTVSLLSPNARLVKTGTLDPLAIIPLYSFGAGDAPGVWNLTIGEPGGQVLITFHLLNTEGLGVGIKSTTYSLVGGNLSISGSTNLGYSYDQEVCVSSNDSTNEIRFLIPQNLGAGNVTVSRVGSQFFITTTEGRINSPFAFSFDLYFPYSFNLMDTNTLLTSNLRAATSQPILVNSSASSSISLHWNFPPRNGRYEIRGFFRSDTGLTVSQSRILMVNGSWTPFDSCVVRSLVSQNFTLEDSLASGPLHWPRSIYLMYRFFGVEGVSSVPVSANLSGVSFLASPWQVPLQDIKVELAPNPRILQVSEDANSAYVLAAQYPLTINFSVAVGGSQAASGSLTIENPYALTKVNVDVARLSVLVSSDDSSAKAHVEVFGANGVNITRLVNVSQRSSFFLPPGTYRVTVSQGLNSLNAAANLANASDNTVRLDLSTFQRLELALTLTAIIGAVSILFYWAVDSRSLKPRLTRFLRDQDG